MTKELEDILSDLSRKHDSLIVKALTEGNPKQAMKVSRYLHKKKLKLIRNYNAKSTEKKEGECTAQ